MKTISIFATLCMVMGGALAVEEKVKPVPKTNPYAENSPPKPKPGKVGGPCIGINPDYKESCLKNLEADRRRRAAEEAKNAGPLDPSRDASREQPVRNSN